jgi:Peptidase A4 family
MSGQSQPDGLKPDPSPADKPSYLPQSVSGGSGGPMPEPDPIREPELHRIWKEMMGKDVRPIDPKLEQNLPGPAAPLPGAGAPGGQESASHFQVVRRNQLASRNWSGAVVPAVAGRRYTQIGARWTVPKLPKEKPAEGGALISVWIGLGGWQRWSNSMPHMGSEHGWDENGEEVNRLWCQWWCGEDVRAGWISTLVTNMKLSAGDEVVCYLAVTNEVTVDFRFLNGTSHEFATVTHISDKPVTGSSAEWVVERPMHIRRKPGSSQLGVSTQNTPELERIGLYPLARVESIIMRECAARLGNESDFRGRGLADSDLIELITHSPGCTGTSRDLQAHILRVPNNQLGMDELQLEVRPGAWCAAAKRRYVRPGPSQGTGHPQQGALPGTAQSGTAAVDLASKGTTDA